MQRFIGFLLLAVVLAIPATSRAANSQQDRMKDCNAQATGMTGDARKTFMSSCLAGTHPNCNPAKSKPCGNSCIALSKTCHK